MALRHLVRIIENHGECELVQSRYVTVDRVECALTWCSVGPKINPTVTASTAAGTASERSMRTDGNAG